LYSDTVGSLPVKNNNEDDDDGDSRDDSDDDKLSSFGGFLSLAMTICGHE
jgi:hypothetical protein